jgi:yecA family protein
MVYKLIEKIFSKSQADFSAAEAHGMASGLLCADNRMAGARWLAHLFDNTVPDSEEGKNLLLRLFEETRRLLTSNGFEFELLLPEKEAPLKERVEALKLWCQGFLFGVGAASPIPESEWPEDVREIIRDITEFTKLETQAGGEEDESAFMEITEYLRSVVVLLHDDLHDLKIKDEPIH